MKGLKWLNSVSDPGAYRKYEFIDRPFLVERDGIRYAAATDGRMAVMVRSKRIPFTPVASTGAFLSVMTPPKSAHVTSVPSASLLAALPDFSDVGTKCQVCAGEYPPDGCPDLCEDGVVSFRSGPPAYLWIGSVLVNARLLWPLTQLDMPKTVDFAMTDKEHAVFLSCDKWTLTVMPMAAHRCPAKELRGAKTLDLSEVPA